MEKIKAFFSNAWTSISNNIRAVLGTYPYTAAAIFLVGVAAAWMLLWVL